LLLCSILSLPLFAQSKHVYPIFQDRDTLFTENHTVTCDETWEGDNLFLLCRNNKDDHEMFRKLIGDRHVKYRNYGISEQKDFNGDGKPDFALFAETGTTRQFLLELSSPKGYRRVDMTKTIGRYLHRRQRETANVSDLKDVRLIRSGHSLTISATVVLSAGKETRTRITIPESDFVWDPKR
jgi:hypothetical protein